MECSYKMNTVRHKSVYRLTQLCEYTIPSLFTWALDHWRAHIESSMRAPAKLDCVLKKRGWFRVVVLQDIIPKRTLSNGVDEKAQTDLHVYTSKKKYRGNTVLLALTSHCLRLTMTQQKYYKQKCT